MSKLHVLLLYGGDSSEHEVSIQSARNVYAALDNSRYTVSLCFIDKVGRWWLTPGVDGHHVGDPQLVPVLGHSQFITLPNNHAIRPDVVFPMLHGRNGEDGTVQGLLELMHIPYVGPDATSAAVAMNKDITKRLLRDAGLPVVPWVTWRRHQTKPHYEALRNQLGDNMFVKPARAGSSVGVSKVSHANELGKALEAALLHDDLVLIEQAIIGREIEVAVLGNDDPIVSVPGEIIPGSEFYDYDDKYSAESKARIMAPADLPGPLKERFHDAALKSYLAVGGHGMARVDFFLTVKEEIYIGEVNTIPGFTSISLYPRLMHASGMTYSALVDKLIYLATENKLK